MPLRRTWESNAKREASHPLEVLRASWRTAPDSAAPRSVSGRMCEKREHRIRRTPLAGPDCVARVFKAPGSISGFGPRESPTPPRPLCPMFGEPRSCSGLERK